MMPAIYLQKQTICSSHRELGFYLFILLFAIQSSTDAVTLTGSSEYAVPGSDFTMTCDVPEGTQHAWLYRRPKGVLVGVIKVNGGQCYNIFKTNEACSPDDCSCTTTSTDYGTVFQWVIQPQTGDHGSVWYCSRYNPLTGTSRSVSSPNYILIVSDGPSTVALSPPDTTYTRTEGDTLPDITCTADCRPGCTFVWTKPDNTNFTASAVLSLGQLDRSEHGTYRCTVWNTVGEATISAALTVQYGPGSSVSFQPEQDVLDKVENQTLPDIICAADCEPPCTYIWSGAGTTYPNPLSLSTAVRGNAGQYTCTASNSVSQETKTWNLIVRYPPRLVSLSYTQGGADVPENGSKSLFCSVESYPHSTIQWFYKANNTLLLTTPDVLDSAYTLTTAGCLDTGFYVCSATNSLSSISVTMEIMINVLCRPRQDYRVKPIYRFGLATSETATFPASFISNPAPSFTWTFQGSPGTPITALSSGKDNIEIHNTFEMKNLSAVSVGTRSNMKEDWFGEYIVTATNSQGSETISFVAVAEDRPNPPTRMTVACVKPSAAKVSWKSGGNTQYYQVLYSSDEFLRSNELYPGTVTEIEDGRHVYSRDIHDLEGGLSYFFKIAAYNEHGNTTSVDAVGCTVHVAPANGGDNTTALGLVLGTCAGVVTLLCIVGLVIFYKRNGRLPFQRSENPDEREPENVQLPGRGSEPNASARIDEERSQYQQLDTNAIAMPSLYSEIGSHHHGYQNVQVDEGTYESMGRRSSPNVYEEYQSDMSSCNIYVNTTIAGKSANSGK